MTTKDLENKITRLCHHHKMGVDGHYMVEIYYRGKFYSCHSNNTLAWDRIYSDDYVPERAERDGGYTLKGALKAFYEECKRKNGLR